jgi:hypothetical protein
MEYVFNISFILRVLFFVLLWYGYIWLDYIWFGVLFSSSMSINNLCDR